MVNQNLLPFVGYGIRYATGSWMPDLQNLNNIITGNDASYHMAKFNAYGGVPLAPSAALPGAHFPSLRRHATASPLFRFGMGHRTRR